MAVFRKIVDGKIMVTNKKGLFGQRIEVYTEQEYREMKRNNWWNKLISKIKL